MSKAGGDITMYLSSEEKQRAKQPKSSGGGGSSNSMGDDDGGEDDFPGLGMNGGGGDFQGMIIKDMICRSAQVMSTAWW